MTALYRFMSVWLLLPALLLTGCGSDTTESVTGLTLSSSNSTLDVTQPDRFVTITATVRDAENNLLPNANVRFDTNLGSFSATSNVTSDTKETGRGGSQDAGNGVAAIKLYSGQIAGTATVTAFVNGFQQSVTITISGPANGGGNDTTSQAATVLLVVSNAILDTSMPDRFVTLDATVRDKDNNLLSNAKVEFTTSLGSFSNTATVQALTQTTNAGVSSLKLYPGAVAGTAQIKAYINGVESTASLAIQGQGSGGGGGDTTPQATSLSLVVSNAVLDTALSERFATIEATVRDKDNNLLSNAKVEFSTSLGSFNYPASVQALTQTTASGVASLKLYPGATAGTATVTAYINGVQATGTINITGTVVIPDPPATASVAISASERAIFVAGVGQLESSVITVRLLTSSGAPAQDAPAGVNNVRVNFITQPNGGEYLLGTQASGQLVQNDKTLDVATTNGVATLTLNSGQLPGVIELKAEALDNQGVSYSPAIQTTTSPLSIASGPAHSIVFSYPLENAIENMGNGTYRRQGGLLATDRYGNPVADGTVINLGVIDSVLLSNRPPQINYGFGSTVVDGNASTTAASPVLTDLSNALFQSANITRNNASRFIEAKDRVLLLNAQAADKSRFVANTPTQSAELSANKAFQNTASGLEYIVGASLLGAQVSGVDPDKPALVSGQTVVTDGAASFFLTYPANADSILAGCVDSSLEQRFTPVGSAQVWVVAEASGSSATTIDNQICFSAIRPARITNDSGSSSISGSTILNLRLQDAGSVPLPYTRFDSTVTITENDGGMTVTVGNCNGGTEKRSNRFAQCSLPITVTGGITNDSATITLQVPNGETFILTLRIP